MPALATTSIAWLLLVIMVVGWIVYAALNAGSARRELGSEIELAANRKPYLDDEELEGRRLELVQFVSLIMLVIIVIGLPVYWILEPARMAGATQGQEERFIEWGSQLFAPTGDNPTAFNCAGCHGGMKAAGGVAPFNITDGRSGEVKAVDWYAPALNTVFYRFDEEEVRFIIVYGRTFSPMSPWGIEGGGPLNDQQVDTLLAYIKSIQIDARGAPRVRTRWCAIPGTSRPRFRATSTGWRAVPSRTASTPAMAKRCSTSTSPAARTAARGATRRAGAGAIPACRVRARSVGT